MGDDALQGQGVVVRALEEILFRIGVRSDQGAAFLQRRAEVGAFEAGHHHHPRRQLRVLIADHLDLEVGGDVGQRDRGVVDEIARAEQAGFFGPIGDEHDAAFVRARGGEGVGQFDHRHRARGVVIGAVHDDAVRAHADVVEVSRDHQDAGRRIGPLQPADGVGGEALLHLRQTRIVGGCSASRCETVISLGRKDQDDRPDARRGVGEADDRIARTAVAGGGGEGLRPAQQDQFRAAAHGGAEQGAHARTLGRSNHQGLAAGGQGGRVGGYRHGARGCVQPARQDGEVGPLVQGASADSHGRGARRRGLHHRGALHEAGHSRSPGQAGEAELGGDIGGGDGFVARGAAPALQFVPGQEADVGGDRVLIDDRRLLRYRGRGEQGDQRDGGERETFHDEPQKNRPKA